jgi:demethylmenaquinone methyltransferase / 2-methoxy-6-polyprenyl-1,4-benzoquinol methylase
MRQAPESPVGESGNDRPLYAMFHEVPGTYDRVNKAITLGLDGRWRLEAAQECLAGRPRILLDLCCGTGDLALQLAGLGAGECRVTGLDFSQPMLDLAARKATERGLGIDWRRGDAAHLPFPEAQFDCVGISFGFRNLVYQTPAADRHLAEVLRVLRPGGRFVIVESSQPRAGLVRWLNHLYLRWFVAWVGSWLSGRTAAYRYLARSAARFYAPAEVEQLLCQAGFAQASSRPLLLGAVSITVAVK